MSKWLMPGMLVSVHHDPLSQIPNPASLKYNRTLHRIATRKKYGVRDYMYTLEHCESAKGVPYWFMENELHPVEV